MVLGGKFGGYAFQLQKMARDCNQAKSMMQDRRGMCGGWSDDMRGPGRALERESILRDHICNQDVTIRPRMYVCAIF